MSTSLTNKEALFNEVKGSLFEYLICQKLARASGSEIDFIESLDKNYSNVLAQQDRMVRQFYPEILHFLDLVSQLSVSRLIDYLGEIPIRPRLVGKLINSRSAFHIKEADLTLSTSKGSVPLSIKLNKRNSYVNTKSGGIKSFFQTYFSCIPMDIQNKFNIFVDQEFTRMCFELHELNDFSFPGNFSQWALHGKSELPGELTTDERKVLRKFYARIAAEMHCILLEARSFNHNSFTNSLPMLLGFGSKEIVQLICFHDFKLNKEPVVKMFPFSCVEKNLRNHQILPFNNTSFVEIKIGNWMLQLRVKPMNKFTTTSIKINCAVKQIEDF